jgi:hypothetical protein
MDIVPPFQLDGGRVQKIWLEEDQRAFGASGVVPLMHLAGADPKPRTGFEHVLGEIHGIA